MNLPLKHTVNVAYEAATADIMDFNQIDPFHLEHHGKTAVNYNRDIEGFPVLKNILKKISGTTSVYQSPTDMGVNKVGSAIIDDEVVRYAARQELIRRFFRYNCEYVMGLMDRETAQRVELLMNELDVKTDDRKVVALARQAASDAQNGNKGNEGIFCGAAIEQADGDMVTGSNSYLLHAASSLVIKALLLVPVLALHMAAAQLVDPAPIPVPAGLAEKAVAKAIRVGVAQRGWVVTRQDPGYMEATLNIRAHVARIGIKYDTQAIQINYLDSTNLDYAVKKDVRYIHANYLKWVDNVVRDITVQLTLASDKDTIAIEVELWRGVFVAVDVRVDRGEVPSCVVFLRSLDGDRPIVLPLGPTGRVERLLLPGRWEASLTVGPSLGQDSLRKSLLAGLVGFIIVLLFMVIYYRLPGVSAVFAVLIYALIAFAIFRGVPVTLTLAGIAGFLLSTGSALDANILTFERLKEELRAGQTLRQAVKLGWERAWPSILDSNIATLITCAILFLLGNTFGATIVKGFSLTQALGVPGSLFTAILVTRTVLSLVIEYLKPVNFPRWFGMIDRHPAYSRPYYTQSPQHPAGLPAAQAYRGRGNLLYFLDFPPAPQGRSTAVNGTSTRWRPTAARASRGSWCTAGARRTTRATWPRRSAPSWSWTAWPGRRRSPRPTGSRRCS